jgi:type II secretory pathway component PulJ
MVRRRAGHSLAELVVATALLGTALAGAASVATLASRWTTEAVTRQIGLGLTEAVLDSLLAAAGPPAAGERARDDLGLRIRWEPDSVPLAASPAIPVALQASIRGRPLLEVRVIWTRPVPGPLP